MALSLLRRCLSRSRSASAHYCSSPVWRPAGCFSTLSGNHWNQMQVLIIIHLPTVSPLVSEPALPLAHSAFPRPPRHIPPPPVSSWWALRPAAPPFLERKSATAICTPGLWTTLNLKGCKARYQRVISFMQWRHWRGAWSEQRVNSQPRR